MSARWLPTVLLQGGNGSERPASQSQSTSSLPHRRDPARCVPLGPQKSETKGKRVCMPMPRLCVDIPLCTRQLGPEQVMGAPPAPDLHAALAEEFAVPGPPSSRDAALEASWADHNNVMSRHHAAQRGYQQRQVQQVRPATLQVVPRRVATQQGARPGSVADPLALERPALGLMLDSEAVLRQMQLGTDEVVAAPAPPEAMPASVRMFLPPEPVQSDGDALPVLVGDLFGAQVRARRRSRSADPHMLAARGPCLLELTASQASLCAGRSSAMQREPGRRELCWRRAADAADRRRTAATTSNTSALA